MGYGDSGREKTFKLSSINTLKESFSRVQLFVTPWTVACQAPSVHGILQARILEWVAIPFSRGFSWPRDRTQVSSIAGRFFTIWATRETNLLPPCSKAHYLLSEFQEELSTHFCFHLCLSPASFPTQLPHNFFSTIAKPISFKISMTLFYSKPSGTPDFTENRS